MESIHCNSCLPFVDCARHTPRPTIAGAGSAGDRCGREKSDEVELIHRVAARDGGAFETLYRGYYPRLKRFIERVTRRPQLVDEVVDDTMLVVWRKASSYDLSSGLSTWIFGIAFRRALKALKGYDVPVDFDPDLCPEQTASGPEGMLQQQETRACIARALATLSISHRAVLELCYFEGRSCAEIAEIMQCPVSTVKTRMFHARRRLRDVMSEQRPTSSCRSPTSLHRASAAMCAGRPLSPRGRPA